MKLLVSWLVLLCLAFVGIEAQSVAEVSPGLSIGLGLGGIPPSQFYHNFVLQAAVAKIPIADMPEDLQLKVADVLSNAEVGFSACDSLAVPPGAVWQQKRCSIFQMKNVLLKLSAIEKEAVTRNATVTADNN